MKDNSIGKSRQKRSLGLILTLTVISLLAGASVSASVEDFVEPNYVEDNPYAGVVDDAVGDATWEDVDRDKKGIKNSLKTFLKNRMDISDEDRQNHLMERVEAHNSLKTALQFCLDNINCNAEPEFLELVLISLDDRTPLMEDEIRFDKTADAKEWEEKKSDWDDMEKDDFDIKSYKNKPMMGLKNWDSMDKNDIYHKMSMTMNSAIAISYCIDNQDCGGLDITNDERHDLNSLLTKIGEEMANRHVDYEECHEDLDCEREAQAHSHKKGPKGLITRMKNFIDNGDDEEQNLTRENLKREDFTRFEINQEECQDKDGTWTAAPDRGEDYYYCAWNETTRMNYDKQADNQEDCEAKDGTWTSDSDREGEFYCACSNEDLTQDEEESVEDSEEADDSSDDSRSQ